MQVRLIQNCMLTLSNGNQWVRSGTVVDLRPSYAEALSKLGMVELLEPLPEPEIVKVEDVVVEDEPKPKPKTRSRKDS